MQQTVFWSAVVFANVVGIAIALGAGELYARHVETQRQEASTQGTLPMCRADDVTIWRYRPNVNILSKTDEYEMGIKTNDVGLRGENIPPGQGGILFIGDSFTFGWGVSDKQRFSGVVQDALPGVRVINAGHWMQTFDQQLLLMKELIHTYKPKVVVQGFFWMHIRTLYNHKQIYRNGKMVAVTDDKLKVDAKGELRFRSDWLEKPPLGSQLLALIGRAWLNRDLQSKATEWADYVRTGRGGDETLWKLTEAIVLETAATLKEQDIAYVPFLIPAGVELGDMWANLGWSGSPPADADTTLPARRLKAIFAKAGIPLLDLMPILKGRGGSSLYFPKDGHWNADGHRVAGEALVPLLKEALQ